MVQRLEKTGLEKLAFQYYRGEKDFPTLVFLPGFRSDMNGNKAQYLAQQCQKRSQSCLLLDYSGHGESGGKFEEGSIGKWTKDALSVIDHATSGPLIVVGSSMGGWIALHAALARKERVVGMVGIAAAPDFTRDIKKKLSDQYKNDLEHQGFFAVPSEYGEDLIITQRLLEDGENQCLLDRQHDLAIPITLIQGKLDPDVPWKRAEEIKASLPQAQVEIVYIEDGDHRLSREQDLRLIDESVEKMVSIPYAGGG